MVFQHLKRRASGKLALVAFVAFLACASYGLAFDPTTGSTVSGSGFYVSGTSGYNLSTYAYMNQSGGPYYMGQPVQTGSNYVFYFQDIPPGSGYSITVEVWDNPPHFFGVFDITVD